MSIRITHIRLSGSTRTHEHITDLKWVGIESGETGSSTKATLVEWIDDNGKAYVGTGSTQVQVGVVRPNEGAPYLRTYADQTWTNNLLELLKF